MTFRRELTVYAVLAALGVLPAVFHGATVGDGVDAFGTHWFFWWIRYCVEHFGNPSHTTMFFFPTGKDIFAHTGNNFVDAVMSLPFQWVLGPHLYQPVFIVFVLIGNALAFRPLARYVLGEGIGAFVATVLWQVNPFLIFEVTAGRPTQAFAWFVPITVYYFLRASREEGAGNAVRLGASMAVAAWTYWFNGYFLVLTCALLAPFELWRSPARRRVLSRWALGAVVCAAIVAPGAILMARAHAEGAVPGLDPTEGSIFSAPKAVANNVSQDLHGLWLMEIYGAPLFFQPAWGVPLLAALFWPKLHFPGGRAPWVVAMAGVLLFSNGPVLRYASETPLVLPWYMAAYRYLPFFDRLWFPYRMAVCAFVPAALLVGAVVSRFGRPLWWLAGLLAVGLGGQAYAGIWPFNWHDGRAPRMLAELKEEGGALMFLPLRIQHDGLMWQTEFELPTFGGMGESAQVFWTKGFRQQMNTAYVRSLRGAAMVPPLIGPSRRADRDAFTSQGFRWVVLRLGLFEQEIDRKRDQEGLYADPDVALAIAVRALSDVVGYPPVGLEGDALLWDLKGTFVPSDPSVRWSDDVLEKRAWRRNERPKFESQLELLGRSGTVKDKTDPKRPR